jgi:predicted DNA-binding transcriptional regulator YafY
VPGVAPGGGPPRTTTAETLAAVRAAALSRESVWIGYVNAEGAVSQRVIAPFHVNGGYVAAFDHTTEQTLTFALHRITGVCQLADAAEPA